MGDITRRKFVTTVAGTGAAMTIVPRHVLGHGIQAPSDTVNIAVIGFGMGASNAQALMSQNLVAFCDVHDSRMAAAIKRFETAAAASPTAAQRGGGSAQKSEPSKAQQEANARRPAQNSRDNAAPVRRPEPAEAEEVPRLSRDAREAEGHRRGRHRDAGPHARADRHAGHGPRQARLRAEAALLVGRGSAGAGEEGEGSQGRQPDGQPGPLDRRRAHRLRVDQQRRDRRSARGARLDQPAARLLAAGHPASGAARGRSRNGRSAGTAAPSTSASPRRSSATIRSPTISTGTCSSAGLPQSTITRSITRSTGAAGWTGARARSATWARTSSTIRSGR